MSAKKKNGGLKGTITSLIIVTAAVVAFFSSGKFDDAVKDLSRSGTEHTLADLKVTFLNIGQGDCEIIELPDGRVILIDCGEKEQWKTVATYLDKENIGAINYCIATHPHSDHMGAMSYIIERYDIEEFYMPAASANTKVFNAMLDALDNKAVSVNQASAGVSIIDEADLKAEFLAPVSDNYDDLNNYSAVLKLTYGDTSFLFTGDAEKESEREMLDSNPSALRCDVLKVGHHGSSTSSSEKFLNAAAPEYAVISCGKDNDYGHPHKETTDKLTAKGVNILRTDEDGTIVMRSDGVRIKT